MLCAEIGWTPAIAFHFSEFDNDQLIAARVVRRDRGRLVGLCSSGEVPATWATPLATTDNEPIDAPAVGDWCALERYGDSHRVAAIAPRRTRIARAVASGPRAEQVLAANVDVAFVVTGLDGDYSLRRIERYLVLARSGGVRPVVVLNKSDLCSDVDTRMHEVEGVAGGAALLCVSALQDENVSAVVRELALGQTAIFLGSSGSGKSTLINRLLGRDRQATAPVRSSDDRGTHTTTRRELVLIPGTGAIIDTPGLRAVGLDADTDALAGVFADVAVFAPRCRFVDCRHEAEPGCAVREAVDAGDLSAQRLESFIKLRDEAEGAALRRDTYARRQHERQTIGHYRKWMRESQRLKGRK